MHTDSQTDYECVHRVDGYWERLNHACHSNFYKKHVKLSSDTVLCCTHSFENEVSAAIDLPEKRKKLFIQIEKNETVKVAICLNGLCAFFCIIAYVVEQCKKPIAEEKPDFIPESERPFDDIKEDSSNFNSNQKLKNNRNSP